MSATDDEELTLPIKSNSLFRLTLALFDEANALIDVTGWEGRLQIRPSKESPELTHELNIANGGLVFGITGDNEINLYIPKVDVESKFRERHQVWDLLIDEAPPGGDEENILSGPVEVSFGVTKDQP